MYFSFLSLSLSLYATYITVTSQTTSTYLSDRDVYFVVLRTRSTNYKNGQRVSLSSSDNTTLSI